MHSSTRVRGVPEPWWFQCLAPPDEGTIYDHHSTTSMRNCCYELIPGALCEKSGVVCCGVVCCDVLCCAVLCCAVLCCAVLCCAVLCCVASCRVVSCRVVLFCDLLGGGWGRPRLTSTHLTSHHLASHHLRSAHLSSALPSPDLTLLT
eukprot:gene12713-biopygen3043